MAAARRHQRERAAGVRVGGEAVVVVHRADGDDVGQRCGVVDVRLGGVAGPGLVAEPRLPGQLRGERLEERAFAEGRGPDPRTEDSQERLLSIRLDPLLQ